MRRTRVVVSVVAAIALVVPAAASAHATLEHTVPAFEERFASAPRVVRLSFSEAVDPVALSVKVYTAAGRVVSGKPHAMPGNRAV